jgi:Na+-transporting methylmalonyl-CoA/oxaloacetate decarboxylase gamma subunit
MATCFNFLFLFLFLFILITPVIQELEKNWVNSCVAQEPF